MVWTSIFGQTANIDTSLSTIRIVTSPPIKSKCLISAVTGHLKFDGRKMSGNASNQEPRRTISNLRLRKVGVEFGLPVSRLRAIFAFIFSGGLIIFASPYFIHQAVVKRVPCFVPLIVIPLYALLSYGAFKVYWPRIKRLLTSIRLRLGSNSSLTYLTLFSPMPDYATNPGSERFRFLVANG
jgi:hypothetical protein